MVTETNTVPSSPHIDFCSITRTPDMVRQRRRQVQDGQVQQIEGADRSQIQKLPSDIERQHHLEMQLDRALANLSQAISTAKSLPPELRVPKRAHGRSDAGPSHRTTRDRARIQPSQRRTMEGDDVLHHPLPRQSDNRLLPELPPEILDVVVDCLTPTTTCPSLSLYGSAYHWQGEARKLFATCSLTCRYLARRCRPYIYKAVILHSLEDLIRLVTLLQESFAVLADISSLPACVQYVLVRRKGPWPIPWFHRLHGLTWLLVNPVDIEVELTDGNGTLGPRSFCTCLPATLPSSVFPFRRISLTHFRFTTMTAFLHLIASLPQLEELDCKSLSFDTVTSPPERSLLRRLARSRLSAMSICQTNHPVSGIPHLFSIASMVWKAARGLHVPETVWRSIEDAAETLRTPFWSSAEPQSLRLSFNECISSESNVTFHFPERYEIILLLAPTPGMRDERHITEVQRVTIAFCDYPYLCHLSAKTWPDFLQSAVLKFELPISRIRLLVRGLDLFKEILLAEERGTFLKQVDTTQLVIEYDVPDAGRTISREAVLSDLPLDRIGTLAENITLGTVHRVDLLLCEDMTARREYIRQLYLTTSQSPHPTSTQHSSSIRYTSGGAHPSPYMPSSEITVPQREYAANIQRNHTAAIPTVEFFVNGANGRKLSAALSTVYPRSAHQEGGPKRPKKLRGRRR